MEKDEKQSVVLKKRINDFREVLTKSILDCNTVYLVGHKVLDFDAIASLGAMALVCKKLKKAPYIVVDQEELDDLETNKDKFYEHEMLEKIKEKFVVINLEDYENNKQENSLLIILDVNKGFKTPFKNHYDDFKKILILDHHKTDDNTLMVNNKLILDEMASSCSEIMYWLLKQYKVKPNDVDYYTFLLIGIYLDTKKGTKPNTKPSTRDCINELEEEHGADKMKAELFLSPSYESVRRSYELFNKAEWLTLRYAISVDNEEEYTRNEVAYAADLMTSFVCEAAIFCGKNKAGSYEICARSNRENVNIPNIMKILNNGGGTMTNAACEAMFIDGEGKKENEALMKKIKNIIYLNDVKQVSPQPRKRYCIKSRRLGKEKTED